MDATPVTEPVTPPPRSEVFAPVAESQRIEALDVVRGFALLGIFLMNIEWFNRPISAINEGMPRGLTGVDWLASWFIGYFVQGKFWTIFSLLFGMGFAVMLVRAERSGREFIKVYLRRILALAVFGAVHYIYIWEGDILFSYAVGALALLIVLYGRARPILIGCAVLIGLGFIPGRRPLLSRRRRAGGGRPAGAVPARHEAARLARCLAADRVVLLMLARRGDVDRRGRVLAAARRPDRAARAAERVRPAAVRHRLAVMEVPRAGREAQAPHGREHLRLRRRRDDGDGPGRSTSRPTRWRVPRPRPRRPRPAADAASARATARRQAARRRRRRRREERAAEMKAEREKRLDEQATRRAEEIKAFTTGTYLDAVEWRARQFLEKAAGDVGFAVVLVSMFLLGVWFVRSGVMADTARSTSRSSASWRSTACRSASAWACSPA